jgi:integrase
VKDAPDPFTEEERDTILAFFRDQRPRWYPLVATLFWSGMRPGELAALRIADVDLERRKISITKSRDAARRDRQRRRSHGVRLRFYRTC